MTRNNQCCSVAKCGNYGRKTNGIIYHRFPIDKARQKEWVSRCKREDPVNVRSASICSAHFLPEDYKRDLQNELLGLPVKKRLLPTAVPSQNIPNWHGNKTSTSDNQVNSRREERSKKREIRKRALATLKNTPPIKKKQDQETNTYLLISEFPEVVCKDREIKRLTVEIESLKRRNEEYKAALGTCMEDLKKAKSQKPPKPKGIVLTPRKLRLTVEKEVQKILGKCFTPGQIRCLIRGTKQGKWSSEDIENANAIRSISRKSYAYLKKLNIPLPGHSTLRFWAKRSKTSNSGNGVETAEVGTEIETTEVVNEIDAMEVVNEIEATEVNEIETMIAVDTIRTTEVVNEIETMTTLQRLLASR